jgi:hypothetical protein
MVWNDRPAAKLLTSVPGIVSVCCARVGHVDGNIPIVRRQLPSAISISGESFLVREEPPRQGHWGRDRPARIHLGEAFSCPGRTCARVERRK